MTRTRKDMHRRTVTAEIMRQVRSQHTTSVFRLLAGVVAAVAAVVAAEAVEGVAVAVPSFLGTATVP